MPKLSRGYLPSPLALRRPLSAHVNPSRKKQETDGAVSSQKCGPDTPSGGTGGGRTLDNGEFVSLFCLLCFFPLNFRIDARR